MGGVFSKRPAESPSIHLSGDSKYKAELSSYEIACKLDPDLNSFDRSLQARTNHVINTLSFGIEVQSLSFDSLKEVTGCLLEMNQEVVKVILECKQDIWKTHELFELVQEYLENSLQTLDFCTTLDKCLKRARDSQLIIQVALKEFEDEQGGGEKKYSKTMEELKNFKKAGDPFTEEFFQTFKSMYKQHALMLEKLQIRQSKIDKKLKSLKTWRRVSSVIFGVSFAAVLICSVVAASIAAPPVAAALAAATSIPIGSAGKWFDSLWKKYEAVLKGQNEIVLTMQAGTYFAINDLDSIRILVERLELEIDSLMQAADFARRGDEAVKFGIEEIRKKLGVFMQSIESLGEHAVKCSRDVTRARTVLLQRIIKLPSN